MDSKNGSWEMLNSWNEDGVSMGWIEKSLLKRNVSSYISSIW
jgi:hypothetical protein